LGANTLRAYHHLYNKALFRKLYKDHGLYILCGDLLGGYAVGSGASWANGTDYSNPQQQENMLKSVREMVTEYKDEPYILMWVLGNENVYGVANNAGKDPESFFKFVNRAAELIHQLDPSRPVAIANGDLLYLDYIKRLCPAIDVMGANSYRGEQGFGRSLFTDVQQALDRPVLITEYGTSAYGEGYSQKQAEAYQAMYDGNDWEDLTANMAGHGVGNALGGVLFEYMDEWWKANSDLPLKVQKAKADWYAPRSATYKSLQPDKHDTVPQFGFPYIDGWSYEEWFGLISQGDGTGSPFARQLRPSYFTMQDMWKH
jgi:beta-glucuronidase